MDCNSESKFYWCDGRGRWLQRIASTNSINNDASPWTLTRPPWAIYTEPHLGGCRRSYRQCWKRNSLPAISSIWDDEYCELCIENDKEAWKWKRCGKTFRPRHATRAVFHFANIANKGIVAVCKSLTPPNMQRVIVHFIIPHRIDQVP